MQIKRPRGTNDILPSQAASWQYIEEAFRQHCRLYGFGEIRTPIFEHTDLFSRGVGEGTDIVEKEMYTFTDRSERSLTLRPEGTASIVRSYLENRLHAAPQPVKLYYVSSPMFRYDRPQAGRYRQFHQAGVELFGVREPGADAEIIELVYSFFTSLGLNGLEVLVNSIGCHGCRQGYREALKGYYKPLAAGLCVDCQRRMDVNTLRLLDCKVDRDVARGAPKVVDYLCEECSHHFEAVEWYLDASGVSYKVSPDTVRGLDYYNRTVFEIIHGDLGAQNSLCGGGRYDGLVEELGGPPTPAVGFAFGMERLLITLEKEGLLRGGGQGIEVFIAVAGEPSSGDGDDRPGLRKEAMRLAKWLRGAGITAETDLQERSLKAQMKQAGRLGARFVAILGEGELARGTVTLKDMGTGEQREAPVELIVADLKGALGH